VVLKVFDTENKNLEEGSKESAKKDQIWFNMTTAIQFNKLWASWFC